jgi:hypothetical protein
VRISGFPPHADDQQDLAACFGEFLRRTVPTSQAYVAAREIAESVAHHLRSELYPRAVADPNRIQHLVAGGVGKRIAIAPIVTVDLLFVLPAALIENRAVGALKAVWAVLKQRLPDTTVAPDQSGVLVPADGVTVKVKVMPSAPHAGAFLVPGFAGVNRATGWNITNPIAEAATLRLADSLYGGRPRLLLACLKAWKRRNDVPVSAFALELLVQDFYASAPRPFALGKALIDFWAWVRKRTPTTLHPPGAHTPVEVTDAWHAKAKAAYWRVTMADYHAENDKIGDAALEWRAVLGEKFPVPGEDAAALPMFPARAR